MTTTYGLLQRATASQIVRILGRLQHSSGTSTTAVLRFESPAQINWHSFPTQACDLPGSNVGQIGDARFSVADGSGLHGQRLPDGSIEFHLDETDGCRSPIEHGVRETRMVDYTIGGGLVLGIIGYFVNGPRGALMWGSLGAGGGAVLGTNTPRRPRRVFRSSAVFGMPGTATGLPTFVKS